MTRHQLLPLVFLLLGLAAALTGCAGYGLSEDGGSLTGPHECDYLTNAVDYYHCLEGCDG